MKKISELCSRCKGQAENENSIDLEDAMDELPDELEVAE